MESLDWTFIVGASFFERRRKKHRGGMEWKRRKWWTSRIARTCVFSPRKVSSRAKTERNRACIRSVRASNEKYRLQSSRQGRTTRGTKQNRARSINARSSSQPLRVTTAVDGDTHVSPPMHSFDI